MKDIELLTDKEMDFLREMLNIGAGNAAGAFAQMLNCPVDVKIPEIYFLSSDCWSLERTWLLMKI